MDTWHTKIFYQYAVCGLSSMSNAFVFPDLEPPAIGTLYGWSGSSGQSGLCSCLFSPVTSSKLIIIFLFFVFACLINSALHNILIYIRLAPYVYEITQSRVYKLLSSFALREILLIFSVNTMCTSLINLSRIRRIVLLFFRHVCSPQIWFLVWWHTSFEFRARHA